MWRVEKRMQLSARSETNASPVADNDGFACARIATYAGFGCLRSEYAEFTYFYSVACQKIADHDFKKHFHNVRGVVLR